MYFCLSPTCIACRNWCSNFSVLGPRQLALPVEIGVPISLCWGPANSHIIVSCIFASFCVGSPPI
ncbi:hypothetical protein B1T33_06795 [Staphylococcus aureus]|nr:hypothetical protein B1T33_06795 [Staphylococcus aureus]